MHTRRPILLLALAVLLALQLGCLASPFGDGGTAGSGAGECKKHKARMSLSSTSRAVRAGETVTLTAELSNVGCAMIGLPKYTLTIDSKGTSVLEPGVPQPVEHSLAIRTGESDTAEFVLLAANPGRVTLSASASFEVHLDYPGPAYWSNAGTGRLKITVEP
jgi:hypothetical protein